MSVDLTHHEIFRAKVGKGGINEFFFVILKLDIAVFECHCFVPETWATYIFCDGTLVTCGILYPP